MMAHVAAAPRKSTAQQTGRVPNAVEPEENQIGDQDAEARRGEGLHNLDRPYQAAEIMELMLQLFRQPQPIRCVREAHVDLTIAPG